MATHLNTSKNMDRDWSAVWASAAGLIFSLPTLTIYPFGVFVLPVGHELGWTRGQMSGALSFSAIALITGSLLWGAVLDKFGGRRTIIISVLGLGLSISLFAFLRAPLWHLYVVFIIAPLFAGAASGLGYSGVLVRRFSRRLGLAVGLSLTGVGLGAGLVPSLSQALIGHYGWRSAYVVLGLLAVIIGVPAAMIATRHDSTYTQSAISRTEVSILPLIHTRAFILICVVFFLLSTASIGTLTHLVPMMIDRGFSPNAAARIAGLTGLSTLISTGVIGWALDRVHAPYILCISSLCLAGSCALLALHNGLSSSILAAVVLGLFVGSEVDYLTFLIRKYFVQSAFGRLYGLAFSAFILGPGAVLLGYSFDRFHGYRPGLLLFVVLSVLAAALALGLPRYEREITSDFNPAACRSNSYTDVEVRK